MSSTANKLPSANDLHITHAPMASGSATPILVRDKDYDMPLATAQVSGITLLEENAEEETISTMLQDEDSDMTDTKDGRNASSQASDMVNAVGTKAGEVQASKDLERDEDKLCMSAEALTTLSPRMDISVSVKTSPTVAGQILSLPFIPQATLSLDQVSQPSDSNSMDDTLPATISTSNTLDDCPPAICPPTNASGADAHQQVNMGDPTILNPTHDHVAAQNVEDQGIPSDEDEDEDQNDEMSSELSEGDDLQDELEDALADSNFSFNGSFYHANLLPSAPNPCLHISGLGLVGLPLSERDAQAVISCATLAPFGHGERTVVDKTVRDTWEIEPARISFANPQWGQYINETVCAEVCKSLGVSISGKSAPKMELYKLLLYETGSHFLPHQDTQKANGMFATVIVLLPSAYTGGQLIVSHASRTMTIDFAQNSLLSFAVLAWYTDVKHEVKPVTSGYRLALSYNLIHVAPSTVPCPSLPCMNDSVGLLRRVLRKWKHDKYQSESEQRLIAYLLDHQYSTMNLKDGLSILKGADAHRVTFLRDVAEEMGFLVGLASLEHNISGYGDDDGGHYHNRGRYGRYGYHNDYDDDCDSETPGMLEVNETTTSISGLVDLNGTSLVSTGKIYLNDESLIPKNPFEDKDPDDTEYEGYMGNGAGQLDYWYRRTVLVLIHEDNLDDICFGAEGIPWGFRMLKKSTTIPPTEDDRKWAARLLEKSNAWNRDQLATMMDYALKWKDLEMWKGIMKSTSCSLKVVDNDFLLKAWRLFSFENVCLSFETILARSTELPERMSFIYNVSPKAIGDEKQIVHAWCKKESNKVLASYSTANIQDIPTIMSIIRVAGLNSFIEIMMPNLCKKAGAYAFWLAFRKSLAESRDAILERQTRSHSENTSSSLATPTEVVTQAQESITTENILDRLIKKCLELAASQWASGPTPASSYTGYPYQARPAVNIHTNKIDRIIDLVEQCIISDETDICRALFVDILKTPGAPAAKFTQIYTPLIPRLRLLLTKMSRDIYAHPFLDLMQVFIGTYLREVLGKKDQMFNCNLRKIGCGCSDCRPLDTFIMDPRSTETVFRLAQPRRQHLERQIASAPDLCTYQTIRSGSPHGVKVTKLPAVVQASMWEHRQKAAKAFLATIGPNDVIAKIMGARYADVTLAINGTQLFGSVHQVPPVTSRPPLKTINTISMNAPAQGSSSNVTHPTAAAATTQPPPPLAGKKRKNGPVIQLGPVIDLTGEDSS